MTIQDRKNSQTEGHDELEDVQNIENLEWINRRSSEAARRASMISLASIRRRQIDPTTCERDYSSAELEFMLAMQEYKRKTGCRYPTWAEALKVLRALGYDKRDAPGAP